MDVTRERYFIMLVNKPQSAEMHIGPGFRIEQYVSRPDSSIVKGLALFDTPSVSDLMNRLYSLAPGIHSMTDPALPIAGPAITVKVFPGDNLMVHKSLDIAEPGDVVVVDARASTMTAVLGDLVCTKARHRGVAGFVVDGFVRDLPAIQALGNFPVYARGATPIGPLHRGPGEINYPISVGGVVVQAGDIIIGDANGVVVVPRDVAPELLSRLKDRSATEAAYYAAVARGEFSNEWVDSILMQNGVTFPR
jgi:RraA family protein